MAAEAGRPALPSASRVSVVVGAQNVLEGVCAHRGMGGLAEPRQVRPSARQVSGLSVVDIVAMAMTPLQPPGEDTEARGVREPPQVPTEGLSRDAERSRWARPALVCHHQEGAAFQAPCPAPRSPAPLPARWGSQACSALGSGSGSGWGDSPGPQGACALSPLDERL